MLQRRVLHGSVTTGVLLLLQLLLMSVAEAAPNKVATVQMLSGQLQVQRQGTKTVAALTEQESLYSGDITRTSPNSKAALLFELGLRLILNAGAIVEMTPGQHVPTPLGAPQPSPFRVVRGEAYIETPVPLAVQTPSATVAASGTAFVLQVAADGTTTITVVEGSVAFFNAQGTVTVGAGQQSVAQPGAAPTAAANAGLIVEWWLDLGRVVLSREKFFVSRDGDVVRATLPQRQAQARVQANEAQARREYGDALFDSDQFALALAEYEAAERLTPGQAVLLTRLGDTLLELHRLNDAAVRYRAALGLAPAEAQPAEVLAVMPGAAFRGARSTRRDAMYAHLSLIADTGDD